MGSQRNKDEGAGPLHICLLGPADTACPPCGLLSVVLLPCLCSGRHPLEAPLMVPGEGQCLCTGDLLFGFKEFSFPPEGTSPAWFSPLTSHLADPHQPPPFSSQCPARWSLLPLSGSWSLLPWVSLCLRPLRGHYPGLCLPRKPLFCWRCSVGFNSISWLKITIKNIFLLQID